MMKDAAATRATQTCSELSVKLAFLDSFHIYIMKLNTYKN